MAKIDVITFEVSFRWWFFLTFYPCLLFCVLFDIKPDLTNNKLFKYSIKFTKVSGNG